MRRVHRSDIADSLADEGLAPCVCKCIVYAHCPLGAVTISCLFCRVGGKSAKAGSLLAELRMQKAAQLQKAAPMGLPRPSSDPRQLSHGPALQAAPAADLQRQSSGDAHRSEEGGIHVAKRRVRRVQRVCHSNDGDQCNET